MINWAQIKQLEEDVGAEDLAEVIEVFLEEVDEAVDILRGANKMTDAELAPALHFLKGSAANLGFAEFADLCSEGEKLANASAGDQVDLSAVVMLYDTSRQEFLDNASSHCSFSA